MAELTRRYIVMSLATEGPFDPTDPEGAFVLKPWKDPAALRALEVYRDHCYPELARDLDAWVLAIRSGPLVRGGVGARNSQHMATMGSATAKTTAPGKPVTRTPAKRRLRAKAGPKRSGSKGARRKAKRRH